MTLIDGKAIAQKTHAETKVAVAALKARGVTPGLAVVLVGDDDLMPRAYVRSKDKMCHELGMHSVKHELPAATTQGELIALVESLNADPAIHGILVQSPPPPHIDERAIIETIDPRKDVDGFHPMNVAKLTLGDTDGFVPCTPLGCQRLLIESGIETAGANVVVLGRSMIVGKPLAFLLMNKAAAARPPDRRAFAHQAPRRRLPGSRHPHRRHRARPEFVRADFVKDGAVGHRCRHQPGGRPRRLEAVTGSSATWPSREVASNGNAGGHQLPSPAASAR